MPLLFFFFFTSNNSLYLWQGEECQRHLRVSFLESPTLYSASLCGAKLQFNTLHWLCFWWKSWLAFFIHLGLFRLIYVNSKIFFFSKSDDPSSISLLVAKKKSLLLVNPRNFIPLTFQRRLSLASIDTAVRAVAFKYLSRLSWGLRRVGLGPCMQPFITLQLSRQTWIYPEGPYSLLKINGFMGRTNFF